MRPDAQRQFLEFCGSLHDRLPKMSPEAVTVADAIGCVCFTDNKCDRRGGCDCQQEAERQAQSKIFWEAAE